MNPQVQGYPLWVTRGSPIRKTSRSHRGRALREHRLVESDRMAKKDPRVDDIIAKAPAFARPLLSRLRKAVHIAVPGVEEDVKWRHAAFLHKGILAGMAAFKEHGHLHFWKHAALLERLSAADRKVVETLGRLTSVDQLPSDKALIRILKAAAQLNEDGVKLPRTKPRPK